MATKDYLQEISICCLSLGSENYDSGRLYTVKPFLPSTSPTSKMIPGSPLFQGGPGDEGKVIRYFVLTLFQSSHFSLDLTVTDSTS